MHGLYFEIDLLAFLISLGFFALAAILWHFGKSFKKPTLFFSNLRMFDSSPSTWRSQWANLPLWCQYGTLTCFILAFIDPHFQIAKESTLTDQGATQGIAIYLVVDQSGSMAQTVSLPSQKKETRSKMDVLKEITTKFIKGDRQQSLKGRPNDLIGLVAFARGAHVLVPLTLDHSEIVRQLSRLQVVQNKEQDGTSMGYAVLKTANLITATRHYAEDLIGADSPSYDIKNAIMILLTDGFPAPNPLDHDNPLRNTDLLTAAEYAKQKGIKIYLITINTALSKEEYQPHRHLMQRVAEITGGKYYLLDQTTKLHQVYADIDRLEKSILPTTSLPKDEQPHRYRRVSLYPYFILLGMLSWMVSIALETIFLRRVP